MCSRTSRRSCSPCIALTFKQARSASPHAATRFRGWATAEVGLTAEQADAALLRSVELARSAAAEFQDRRVLVAGSLGPYGAALHNGGEYTGDYDCSYDDLVRFHRERIEVFARGTGDQAPDLLAFETFRRSKKRARWARLWRRGLTFAPGSAFPAAMKACFARRTSGRLRRSGCSFPQTVAIGVNCVPPKWISALIGELQAGSDKPIVVYPNSGEGWDATRRWWTGVTDPAEFGVLRRMVEGWSAHGGRLLPDAPGAHCKGSGGGKSCRGLILLDELERGSAFARSHEVVGAGGDGEPFAGEELANLAAGVVGPGTAVVELDVGAPMAQRIAMLAGALVSEGQVVMRVGVARRKSDGLEVSCDGFVDTFELVEHVAKSK